MRRVRPVPALLLLLALCFLASTQPASASTRSSKRAKPWFLRLPHDESDAGDRGGATNGTIWALLAVGSSGYGNYRHQADVMHSYHVLLSHGIPAENVVVLSADDAAGSPFNPRPGTLINRPGGRDVRAGVPIDYRGSEQVTSEVFLSVLLGDSERARELAPNSTGRVLQSTHRDRVFVFYSDHGAPGLLGMPSGPPLYADSLVGALMNMTRRRDEILDREEEGSAPVTGEEVALLGGAHRGGRRRRRHKDDGRDLPLLPGNATFSEVVLFVEACEAGSMFEGMLPDDDFADGGGSDDDDGGPSGFGSRRRRRRRRRFASDSRGVFALTAANAHESSWGVYCPGMPSPEGTPPVPAEYDTCLGDLFAVSWMSAAEDAGAEPGESLAELAALVARETSRNGTFEMGSHVSEYGDGEEERERASEFLGVERGGADGRRRRGSDGGGPERSSPAPSSLVPQHEADLLHLRVAASRGSDEARLLLAEEVERRAAVDGAAAAVAAMLLAGFGEGLSDSPSSPAAAVSRRLAEELSELHGIGTEREGATATVSAEAVSALVGAPVARTTTDSKGQRRPVAVVDDWACLRAGVEAFSTCAAPERLPRGSQYALRHSRLVARACNAGADAGELRSAIEAACGGAASA